MGGLKVTHRPVPEETSLLDSPFFGLALKACLKLEIEFVISRGKKICIFSYLKQSKDLGILNLQVKFPFGLIIQSGVAAAHPALGDSQENSLLGP